MHYTDRRGTGTWHAAANRTMSGGKPQRIEGSLDHWFEVIEASVHECADHRAGRADVFLWNARKAQEAVILALGQDATDDAWKNIKKDKGSVSFELLARNLGNEDRLHRTVEDSLSTMRWAGNLGAHAQPPQDPVDQITLDACRQAIVQAIKWVYSNSKIQRPMPAKVVEAIRDLESAKPRVPPEQKAAIERAQVEEKLADLKKQFEAAELVRQQFDRGARDENGDGGLRELLQLRKRQQLWILALLFSSTCAICATALLIASWTPARAAAVSTRAATAASTPSGAQRQLCPPCDIPAALPCVSTPTATIAGLSAVASPAQFDNQALAAALGDAPTDVASRQEDKPSNEADRESGAQPVAAEDVSPTCPDNADYVPAKRFRLGRGPHPRRHWPQPPPTPGEIEVAAFCMARKPVLAADFDRWRTENGVWPDSELKQGGANRLPATSDGYANVHVWSAASE